MTLGTRVIPLDNKIKEGTNRSKGIKLIATTDFIDNIRITERGSRYGKPVVRSGDYYENHLCFMDRAQLDGLHEYLSSIGVTRHQWIVDTIWTLYETYPRGFDLLKEAAGSAHKYGIEFYAEIKPFEAGGFGPVLPHSMPFPDGAVALRDMRGIFPLSRPFAARNTSMNLKRRVASGKNYTAVSDIRLIKSDENITRVKPENISLWTSSSNNGFAPYKGPLSVRESIEDRYRFPYWRKCRVFHMEHLKIPPGHTYFLLRCSLADDQGDFSNEKGSIIEFVDGDGNILPHTLSTGPIDLDDHYESFYRSKVMGQLVRYLKLPEVRAEIDDLKRMQEHYHNFYSFDEYNLSDWSTFDKEGYVAAAIGKPEYMLGSLHPIYPEVRSHWLQIVQFCLDRNVDGINFRVSNHTRSPEYWDYGFNEVVVDKAKGKTDSMSVSKVNGDAYTLFLREARKLIKSRGKKITIHLLSDMLIQDNRPGKLNALPPNFEWQWETWVNEIADELEFRGVFKLRPWNLTKVLETFGRVVRSADKPLYLQGDFHGRSFERHYSSTKSEWDLVNKHPALDGYVLYETANFTRINERGKVEGSPDIIRALEKNINAEKNK